VFCIKGGRRARMSAGDERLVEVLVRVAACRRAAAKVE